MVSLEEGAANFDFARGGEDLLFRGGLSCQGYWYQNASLAFPFFRNWKFSAYGLNAANRFCWKPRPPILIRFMAGRVGVFIPINEPSQPEILELEALNTRESFSQVLARQFWR